MDHFFSLLNDVISPTEQVMISKRIAVLYLIMRKVPTDEIMEHIKVSRTTVLKFQLLFYDRNTPLIEMLKRMMTEKEVLSFIDDFFADIFIQPGRKIGHWQLYWDQIKKKSNPLR